MRLLLCLSLAAAIAAAPAASPASRYSSDDDVRVLRYEIDNKELGNYSYSYELSDGTRQEQRGELKNLGQEDESLAVQGFFSWFGPDGVQYNTTYTADENGYKPQIEQGPGGAVPAAVVASLVG